MPADATALEEAARVLLNRADDMYYLSEQINYRTTVDWVSDKADRFDAAMKARAGECVRLAYVLLDLGMLVRAKAAAVEQP